MSSQDSVTRRSEVMNPPEPRGALATIQLRRRGRLYTVVDDPMSKIVRGRSLKRVKQTFECPTESLVERPLLAGSTRSYQRRKAAYWKFQHPHSGTFIPGILDS
jgi:hypothetical protein